MKKIPEELGKEIFKITGVSNTLEMVWQAGTTYFVVITGYTNGRKPDNYRMRLFLRCELANDVYEIHVDNMHYV